jgi:hypothetical protein
MMNNTELAKALTVMVTDPKIRSFLEDNDPMALKQATEALRNHFNQFEEANWNPSPTDYIPTGLSGICIDGKFWS